MFKMDIDIWNVSEGDKILYGENIYEAGEVIKRVYSGYFVRFYGFGKDGSWKLFEGYRGKNKLTVVFDSKEEMVRKIRVVEIGG